MKKLSYVMLVVAIFVFVQMSHACVGKTIHIGIPNTANDKLVAEMISMLITERTGSSVKIEVFKSSKELYNAVKQGQINMLIENPDHAFAVLGKPKETNPKIAYDTVRAEYRKTLNLAWLEPFGGPQQYAPVLTVETLSNYPALPKLLNKLAGVLNGDTYTKLVKSVESEDKQKKVARDFLKAKKLI